MTPAKCLARAIVIATALLTVTTAFAGDKVWSVSKSSGEVWVTTPGAQQASLTRDVGLNPGDAIRTGRNGRVLLVRGEESILLSPNSAIGIPAEAKDGLATTIAQQAGSILLEVEKRNVKHFEVETPYLAAVVKGTKFSVTVSATGTSVNVTRGQVEVADFRSGQIAQIMPGQIATSFAQGKLGLSLSGMGTFAPIEQGRARVPSIERLMVPRNGLSAPRNASNQQVRPIGQIRAAALTTPKPGAAQQGRAALNAQPAPRGLRIASPIGDVRLNIQKATNGVARGIGGGTSSGRAAASREATIWTGQGGKSSTVTGNGSASETNAGASSAAFAAGSASASSAAGSATATVSVQAAASGNAGGDSQGATGSSNGNNSGNGSSGNSSSSGGNNGNGHGNGYGNGNGNGNGGVGNGRGIGNAKH
ncbi:FecR family protein [soil metagenome]